MCKCPDCNEDQAEVATWSTVVADDASTVSAQIRLRADKIVLGNLMNGLTAHNLQISFRQWRDTGHCGDVHTYNVSISIDPAMPLNLNDQWKWSEVQNWLQTFNGSLLVAKTDPQIATMVDMFYGTANIIIVDEAGCERLAQWVAKEIHRKWGLHCAAVEVREHESNAGGIIEHDPATGFFKFFSEKTYTATRGLTVTWIEGGRLRGGSLEVRTRFASPKLDSNNWVVPFGQLKTFKEELDASFDHTFLTLYNSPNVKTRMPSLYNAMENGIIGVRPIEPSIEGIHRQVEALANQFLTGYIGDNKGTGIELNRVGVRICGQPWYYGPCIPTEEKVPEYYVEAIDVRNQ